MSKEGYGAIVMEPTSTRSTSSKGRSILFVRAASVHATAHSARFNQFNLRQLLESNMVPCREDRFDALAREWKAATRFCSSLTEIATHAAYQQIIGMGQDAIPLILSELRREPDHWFWALKAITGTDPVPAADRGQVHRMAQAWLDWADEHGYGVDE